MNAPLQQRPNRRGPLAPAAGSAKKGAAGRGVRAIRGLAVEYEIDVFEGARCVRRYPRRSNLILNKGLDLVSAAPWAMLCHFGVLGTGTTPDLIASQGFTAGGITFGALGLVTLNANFFDAGHVGKTLIFDVPDDYGRASWTVLSVTGPTIAHVQRIRAGGTAYPTFALLSPLPTTVYIVEPGRVALEAAVKYAAPAAAGNRTIISAVTKGSQVNWIHNIIFDNEIAPAHYNEAGWTPPWDITLGDYGVPTYGAAAPLTQQLFGRVILPDGGIDIDTGQHAVLRIYLRVDFKPLAVAEDLAPHWPWNDRVISGVNVYKLNADGTYQAGNDAAPIVWADGVELWAEPSTWQKTSGDWPYVSLDKCMYLALTKSPHLTGLQLPTGVFLNEQLLTLFNPITSLNAVGPDAVEESPIYLLGSYEKWNAQSGGIPYPAGNDTREFQIVLLDRRVVDPADPWRNVFAAWTAGPLDPLLIIPGRFQSDRSSFVPTWDRFMAPLSPPA